MPTEAASTPSASPKQGVDGLPSPAMTESTAVPKRQSQCGLVLSVFMGTAGTRSRSRPRRREICPGKCRQTGTGIKKRRHALTERRCLHRARASPPPRRPRGWNAVTGRPAGAIPWSRADRLRWPLAGRLRQAGTRPDPAASARPGRSIADRVHPVCGCIRHPSYSPLNDNPTAGTRRGHNPFADMRCYPAPRGRFPDQTDDITAGASAAIPAAG